MNINDLMKNTNSTNYFMLDVGAHLDRLEPGHAEVSLVTENRHKNLNGMMHGGALLTLIDSAAGAASRSFGGTRVPLACKTNFIKGVKVEGQKVTAVADVIHNGRTIKVLDVKIYNRDVLSCTASVTMFATSQEPRFEPVD